MRRRAKVLTGLAVVLLITIPVVYFVFNILLAPPEAEPFNLDNAPQYIRDAQQELKAKLQGETLSWNDMPQFVEFSQYLADNSPEIQELTEGWDVTVLFEIGDSDYMWFFVEDGSIDIHIGAEPPQDYGIRVSLSFETFADILQQDETPLSAFQKGTLRFEGPFGQVLTIAQITGIVSATIMGTHSGSVGGGPEFVVTVNQRDKYLEGGLTVFSLFEVTIVPEFLGQHHMSQIGPGSVYILDDYGTVVAQLESSAHTVTQFINSTTIMMGGQEGSMQLWNYVTNTLETLPVPAGHHEIDYNPATDTFMVLEYALSNEQWDGKNVTYDVISEYDREGQLVWQWDGRVYFPFNSTRHTSLGLNETFRGGADWMHSNSFAWDKAGGFIYLNVRSVDSILKIDYNTKAVLWDAGRNGEFTLLNKDGIEVESLFHHPHSLEQIISNRFIIYDNDLYNSSNPSTMTLENSTGHSRLLELEIDETARIMREVWSWTPSNDSYYFPESGGDADRLPNGNTLGTFGNKGLILNVRDPVILTEVTAEGEIAWELQIPCINNTCYWVQRVDRFYEAPIIGVNDYTLDLGSGDLWLNVSAWNMFKIDANSAATVRAVADGQEVYQDSFEFLRQWQDTSFQFTVSGLSSSTKFIEIIVENSDGIEGHFTLYDERVPAPPLSLTILLIIGSAVVAVPVVIWYARYRRPRSQPG
ncbi:MAG: aryl-sulfate sulfotransferase [Candidatus Thorarchaeota archaeon]